jgi:hypothetical protein
MGAERTGFVRERQGGMKPVYITPRLIAENRALREKVRELEIECLAISPQDWLDWMEQKNDED